jgi:hypothetical protein
LLDANVWKETKNIINKSRVVKGLPNSSAFGLSEIWAGFQLITEKCWAYLGVLDMPAYNPIIMS